MDLRISRTRTDITVSMQEPDLKMARSLQTADVFLASQPKEKLSKKPERTHTKLLSGLILQTNICVTTLVRPLTRRES